MVSVDVKHHVYLLTYPNMKTVLSDWGKNLQRQRDEPLDGETKDYDRWRLRLIESTHKGINKRLKYVTQAQRRPEWPTVILTWHACKYKIHELHLRYILSWDFEDVPLVEFMYLHAFQVRVTVGDSVSKHGA